MQLISPLPVNSNAVTLVKGIASITWQFHYEMPAGSILEDLEAILQRASVDPGLKSLVDPLLERVQRLREQESIDASADLFPNIKQFIRDLEPLMAPEHETVRRVYERLRNDCDLLHEIERTSSKMRIPAYVRSNPSEIQSSVPPPQITEGQFTADLAVIAPWANLAPDSIGFFEIKPHGVVKLLYVNDATERVSGFTSGEALNMDFQQTVHGDDRQRFYEAIGMTLASGTGIVENIRIRRKDGSYFTADIRIGFQADRQFGWYILIDQSKRAESIARVKRYEEMLRELELGVMVLDVENGHDPVVLLNSRYLEKLLGYQPDQMIRHSLREFLDQGQTREFRRQVRLFRLTGEMHWLGARLLCADGTATMMDIHGGRTVGPGRYGAIVWFTSSDTRLAQEQYAIQAEVHEREQMWVGGISHNLLNAITTVLAEFDAGRLDGTLKDMTPEQKAMIDLAEKTYKEIAGHIQGLKAIEGGGKREAIDLAALLNEHCLLRRSEGVPIIYEQDGSEAWVQGELGRVLIATDNILRNAMEAVRDRPDPMVNVSVSHKLVDAAFLHRIGAAILYPQAVPGHYVRVRIEDNGIGIPSDKFLRIFDRYATSHTPQLSRGEQGQGWGLPRAREAMRGMRGFIYPRSTENKGSRFDIYLPRVRAVPAQDPIEEELPFAFDPGQEVVLLVDDESLLLTALERIFRSLGFARVITATDGRDALQKYRENDDITFLVTDRQMPHMDGTALINELRNLRPELPVLMFSASEPSFSGDPSIAFLGKPARPTALVPAMEKAAKVARSRKKESTD